VLTVYFGAIAIFGGHATRLLLDPGGTGLLGSGFREALNPADLPLFALKSVGLGTIVGWLCCHFGMEVQNSPTEVPQKSSRAVVMTLLGCVVFNAAVTIGFYWLIGPPIR
jgi:ABC-type transporter Mla maintaining outer membrane lipid asymmetry permease subunit MlaE